MDWKSLITDLGEAGLLQAQIAAYCGVKQSTVSDLKRGATVSPAFDFGTKLLALHRIHCGKRSKRKAVA